jgi:hypothetical protein
MQLNLKDEDICPNCPHPLKEHIKMVRSRQRPGYREVRGKHRYGKCKYMHGVPGFFCKCEGPGAGKLTGK